MELSEIFTSETLKAADLQGHEPVVTIQTVAPIDFENGGKTDRKLKIAFVGKKKALVCNKTNANRIAYMHGTNTDNWIGKKIQLYVDLVDFQGTPKEAIRVRPVKSANGPVQKTAPEVPFNDSIEDIGDTF